MAKEYTIQELSKKFKRPTQTIHHWIVSGKINAALMGGQWMVEASELPVIKELNENSLRYRKKWSRMPKPKTKAKPRAKKKSAKTRKRVTNTKIEVNVPKSLNKFCKTMGIDLTNYVQEEVDKFCNEMIEKIKNI